MTNSEQQPAKTMIEIRSKTEIYSSTVKAITAFSYGMLHSLDDLVSI